jgi:hypothetical protein
MKMTSTLMRNLASLRSISCRSIMISLETLCLLTKLLLQTMFKSVWRTCITCLLQIITGLCKSRQEIFPLSSVSRPALGPPSLLSNGYRGVHHPHPVPRSWMSRSYTSSPLRLHRCVVGLQVDQQRRWRLNILYGAIGHHITGPYFVVLSLTERWYVAFLNRRPCLS